MHQGPYVKRSGVGKHMVRAVHRLPDQASLKDRVRLASQRGDHLFVAARDVNYEEWQLGETVTALDGFVFKESTLEPVLLLRAAYEDGPVAVVETMGKFPENPEVQAFGLAQLVKVDYHETAAGHSNPGGLVALDAVLKVMKAYPDHEAIQGRSLAVLSTLADNYALRWAMFKEDWVSPVVVALNNNQANRQEVVLDRGPDHAPETKVSTSPTRHAVETCAWACKLFGQMACDNGRRAVVADDGLPLVLQAMAFCPEEAVVQMNACKTIYNCVFRCEAAHIMATEEDALSAVEQLLVDFQADPTLILLAKRAVRSLQPDGWHGNSDDPNALVETR